MSARQPIWPFALLGVLFGTVLIKSEVVSWFRIQEMFRFDAFHMYGVIGSAIAVGWIGRALLGHGRVAAPATSRHLVGGTLFGLGWALTGACPGPMYALIGHGEWAYGVALAGALTGTWCYGKLRDSRLAAAPTTAAALGLE